MIIEGVLEGIAGIVFVLLYILLLGILSLGILLGIAIGMGIAGSMLSLPALYALPDVRRFLVLASGGRPDDATPPWRVALRPRYVLLSAFFGFCYGVTFLVLFIPIREFGLIRATVGPVPVLVGIPLAFVLLVLPVAYGVHRGSSAWTETTAGRSVLVQWAVFLTITVTLGTAVPVLAVTI